MFGLANLLSCEECSEIQHQAATVHLWHAMDSPAERVDRFAGRRWVNATVICGGMIRTATQGNSVIMLAYTKRWYGRELYLLLVTVRGRCCAWMRTHTHTVCVFVHKPQWAFCAAVTASSVTVAQIGSSACCSEAAALCAQRLQLATQELLITMQKFFDDRKQRFSYVKKLVCLQ